MALLDESPSGLTGIDANELIQRIKDALGTDEDGDALIEVARNAHRAERDLAQQESDAADDSEPPCTGPRGHSWVYTGTQYGGDDESYHGEGRCYCEHCGADGDA